MMLGATHYNWRPDVRRRVQRTLSTFSGITANTYYDHPWPGWDGVSFDLWGPGGRGRAISRDLGSATLNFLLTNAESWNIRHLIYERRLWTSFGGWSVWPSDDHSGRLRHVHCTIWL